jgi:hypothetical protein
MKIIFVLSIILASESTLLAQDRFEIAAEYSFLRFSPTITGVGPRNL